MPKVHERHTCIDLVLTILAIMAVPVLGDMDGQVPMDTFTPDI